jgi:hypothetical protein
MTNNNPGGAGSTATAARDEAAQVAGEAKDAGKRVVSTAKEEATRVAHVAKGQSRQLLSEVSGELKDQAGMQQQRAAAGLHSIGDELRTMASGTQEPGMATELVDNLAGRVDSAARWLEARDPGSLLMEVKSFARRRPGVFIAIAAGAGVVAGRLVRSLTESANEDTGMPTTTRTTTTGMTSGTMAGTTPTTTTGSVSDTPTFDRVLSETGTEALP